MVSSLGSVSSLFSSSYYGLQNAFQLALQDGSTSISQSDLLNSYSKNAAYLYSNGTASAFTSYLSTNFKNVDSNNDGKITADEMTNVMSTMSSQGLTYQQIMNVGTSSGMSSEDVNTILSNFNKIDKNGDGKVSSSEISYYSANKKINDKIEELKKSRAGNISLFVDTDDNSTSTATSDSTSYSSVLSSSI